MSTGNQDVVFSAIPVEIVREGSRATYKPGAGDFTTLIDSIRWKIGVAQAKTGLTLKVRLVQHVYENNNLFLNRWDIIVNDRVISNVPESCLDLVLSGIIVGANSDRQANVQ